MEDIGDYSYQLKELFLEYLRLKRLRSNNDVIIVAAS